MQNKFLKYILKIKLFYFLINTKKCFKKLLLVFFIKYMLYIAFNVNIIVFVFAYGVKYFTT